MGTEELYWHDRSTLDFMEMLRYFNGNANRMLRANNGDPYHGHGVGMRTVDEGMPGHYCTPMIGSKHEAKYLCLTSQHLVDTTCWRRWNPGTIIYYQTIPDDELVTLRRRAYDILVEWHAHEAANARNYRATQLAAAATPGQASAAAAAPNQAQEGRVSFEKLYEDASYAIRCREGTITSERAKVFDEVCRANEERFAKNQPPLPYPTTFQSGVVACGEAAC